MKAIASNWGGKVTMNGVEYSSISDVDFKGVQGRFTMVLNPVEHTHEAVSNTSTSVHDECTRASAEDINKPVEYRIRVKSYMTKPATPEFDFMANWNANKPMPMIEMEGVKVKETRGMVYMILHGSAEPIITCRRCGKTLTNPISRKYGIGPECMSKLGFSYDIDDVENISNALVNVVWEGWIIKSAILECEEVV